MSEGRCFMKVDIFLQRTNQDFVHPADFNNNKKQVWSVISKVFC